MNHPDHHRMTWTSAMTGKKMKNTATMSELRIYLDNLWWWKAGIPEKEAPKGMDLESLRKSEWSDEFERYMRNRLVMGAFRYGKINAPGKKRYDRIGSIRKRLLQYERTGNTEMLVDISNLCLLEFVEPTHPESHFSALDQSIGVEEK
jgi:hypothetical protein